MTELHTQKPGDLVEEQLELAREEVVLVAPYMKSAVVERLMHRISDKVSKIVVVTRWQARDVAFKVSDLEVFDVVNRREGATLWLHPTLHAKYFRFDNRRLTGSANLTMTALGWHFPSNLEILTVNNENIEYLDAFEETLLEHSITATQERKEIVANAAAALEITEQELPRYELSVDPRFGILGWLPRSPEIDVIWRYYSGENIEDVIGASRNAAQYDLAALSIPLGLSKEQFWMNVRATFSLMPLVDKISTLARSGGVNQSDGSNIIANYTALDTADDDGYEADDYWRILQHWLIKLFPGEYMVRPMSTVFIGGSIIN